MSPNLRTGESTDDAFDSDVLPYLPRLRLRESNRQADPATGEPHPPKMTIAGEQVGRYELFDEIARGGMGAVVRGRDLELGRELAVKVMLDSRRDDPQVQRRFVEEAQIGGQLQHPGIAPVYELGTLPDGRPFFTMKLVNGQTLSSLLAKREDPAQDRARFLGVFEQLCQTLAYAHSKGVIHRDLKPANVMVGAFGEVQVMDWGLAKVLAASEVAERELAEDEHGGKNAIRTVRSSGLDTAADSAETHDGAVMGTPAYMSPEQANGETDLVDERSDVFGLGAILCEILTGQPPHVGHAATDTFQRARNADVSEAFGRLEAWQIDSELAQLCKRCLAVSRNSRPRHAGIIADEMSAYFQSVETRLRAAEIATAQAIVKAEEERKRRRITVALAAAVLFIFVLAGSGFVWQRNQQLMITQEISDALSEANSLWQQAKSEPLDQGVVLTQAFETARRAEFLLDASPVDPKLAQRVRGLVGEIDQGRKDRQFVAALEEARIRSVDVDVERDVYRRADVTEHYAAAFREFGIDPDSVPAEDATTLVRSRPDPIRETIVSVLHDWASYEPRAGMRSWLRQVASDADDDPWRRRLFSAARNREDLEELAGHADALRQPPATLLSLSSALFSAGAKQRAVDLLVAAQGKHPDDFWINQQLGSQLLRLDSPKPDEAIPFLTAALSLRPGNAGILFNIGVAKFKQDRKQDALIALRQAVEIEPEYGSAHLVIGHVLSRQEDLDGCIAAYRRAASLRKTDARPRFELAAALATLGQFDESIPSFQEALALDPDYADGHGNLANAYLNKGMLPEAIEHLRAALKLNPKDSNRQINLGGALYQTGQKEEAAAAFQAAVALGHEWPGLFHNLGTTLRDLGRNDEALAAFKRGRELAAGNSQWEPSFQRELEQTRRKQETQTAETKQNEEPES